MFTIGYSFAITTLVSNNVNAIIPDVPLAKYYAKLGFVAILVWALIIQLILEFFKYEIITAFTNAE